MAYGWSRLDREEKLILSLLRGDSEAIRGILSNPLPLNFKYLLTLTTIHRITTATMRRLANDFPEYIPESFKKAVRLLILQHMTADKLRKEELSKASALLGDEGFDVTMMKGFSYDPKGVRLRNFRDVDILVEEDKIRDIISLFLGKGYDYQGSFVLSRKEKEDIASQLIWNNQYQFRCPNSEQVIEIHTNLFERDRIRLEDLSVLLDHPEIYKRHRVWNDAFKCHVPCPEASLLLLCLHCSVKRSLGNNKFILRHMSDMECLLARNFDVNRFISMCQESETVYHAAFTANLYKIIMQKDDRGIGEHLGKILKGKEKTLMKQHLLCLKNLHGSRYLSRKVYNFLAPFIIGGNWKQKMTWLRNNIMSTKVYQENRYATFGISAESPLIYLTYFINPFQTSWRFIKRIFCLEKKPHNK